MDKRDEILKAAREMFYTNGYKNTKIPDIAKAAGIGVGTFYNYFDSKEGIFFEVYLLENKALKERILASVDMTADPITFVTKMLTMNTTEMHANNILKEWYNKALFSKLEVQFKESGELEKLQALMNDGQKEMIAHWQAKGQMRQDISVEMIQAIFKSIPYVDLHKDDIGEDYFPELIEQMTTLILRGLMP